MYSFKKSVCKTGNPFGNHYCRRAYHLKVYMQYLIMENSAGIFPKNFKFQTPNKFILFSL